MKSAVSPRPKGTQRLFPSPLVGGRLTCVDFLRGTVMVLMILDHTRDFFGNPNLDPTNLANTTVGLFLTRWVTHFCSRSLCFSLAPGPIWPRAGKARTSGDLARYLAGRGLFLVVLELTLVRWGWNFNFHYHFILVQVIWVIGLSMITLAGLVAAVSVTVDRCPGCDDRGRPQSFRPAEPGGDAGQLGRWSWLWHVLLRPGGIPLGPDATLHVAYSLLPWFGVMALGFGFGEVLLLERGLEPEPRF